LKIEGILFSHQIQNIWHFIWDFKN